MYRKNGWKLDGFWWYHSHVLNGYEVSFVHIDTTYLFYGDYGEDGKPLMVPYFKKFNWTEEKVLNEIEQKLKV